VDEHAIAIAPMFAVALLGLPFHATVGVGRPDRFRATHGRSGPGDLQAGLAGAVAEQEDGGAGEQSMRHGGS